MITEFRRIGFKADEDCKLRSRAPTQTDPIYHLQMHDCLELGLCHTGQALYLIEGKTYSVTPGDATFINSNVPHFGKALKNSKSLWSWIFVDLHKVLTPGIAADSELIAKKNTIPRHIVLKDKDRHDACEVARKLHLELTDPKLRRPLVIRGLVLQILGTVESPIKKSSMDFP